MNKVTKIVLSLLSVVLLLGGVITNKDFRVVNQFLSEVDQASPIPVIQSFIPIASGSAVSGIQGERVKVTNVVDGDTVEIEDGRKVRYIGMDTPETVDPRRPVGCFGKQAKEENKILVEGKEVIMQKDVSDTDKYDRLLRYIYLPLDGGNAIFVNDYLIREGFAHVLTYPPDVKFNQRFLEAERDARDNQKGLWKDCN